MEDGSKWRMVIRCNNYVWLYFLSIPLPSPSALTSRWRAAKSALVQPALAPQLSLPVCVLQTKIGLSKGQHNARQLKGSHFCLLLSISLNHTFSKWKKKNPAYISEHAVALAKWRITPCCTLPSLSLDSSSSQAPLKMAGTSCCLSRLSPFLCSDLETKMKQWLYSHNCCNTVPLPPQNKIQSGKMALTYTDSWGEGGISASIKIGLGCLSLVLCISH